MVLDVLLVLGLLLSATSQLRPESASAGPGELCLAVWIVAVLTREVSSLGPRLTPVFSRLAIYWLVFIAAMCLGTMTGYAIGDVHDPVWFVHDIVAYTLVAVISCLTVTRAQAGLGLNRVAWLLITIGSVCLGLQAAMGWGYLKFGDFDPWEWDRLRGLSDSSNQLALVCAVVGLISLHLADTARQLGKRIAALTCMTIAIVVGRLTKSDAFLLVLLVAGPAFITLKFKTWLTSTGRTLSLRTATVWLFALALPFMLAYAVPFGGTIAAQAEMYGKEMTRGGGAKDTEDSTRLRFEIWQAAVRRGIESGMLGLGPGPHLEIPNSILAGRRHSENEPSRVEHPVLGVAPNFEAHNTVLDLFMQGGLLVLLVTAWLAGTIFRMTYQARLDGLCALLCGIAIFSFFHFILRHPIVWFAIVFSLYAAQSGVRAGNVERR